MRLKHEVAIYVPANNEAERRVAHDTLDEFANLFGGATMEKVYGAWKDEYGNIVYDHISRVYAKVTQEQFDSNAIRQAIRLRAENIKYELAQESVSIEYDGEMEFI